MRGLLFNLMAESEPSYRISYGQCYLRHPDRVCAFVVSHWQCWCASLEHPPVTHPDWLFIKSGTTVSCVRSCLGFFSYGGEAAPLIHTDGRWIKQGFSRHAETYRPIYYSCRNRKASNTAFGLMRKCDRPTARGHRCVPEYFEIEFERHGRRTQRAPAQQNGPAMRGLG